MQSPRWVFLYTCIYRLSRELKGSQKSKTCPFLVLWFMVSKSYFGGKTRHILKNYCYKASVLWKANKSCENLSLFRIDKFVWIFFFTYERISLSMCSCLVNLSCDSVCKKFRLYTISKKMSSTK